MSDYSWEDDLFDDDDFLDDSFDDQEATEPVKPEKTKPAKKEKGGGLFKKKSKAEPAPEENKLEDDDFDEDIDDEYNDSSANGSDEDEPDLQEDKTKAQTKKKTKSKERNHVHGLKKKEKSGSGKGTAGKVATVVAVVAAVGVAGGLGIASANRSIAKLQQSNENLVTQIASQSMNVYTAKKDIAKGDEIITSGELANVEISQIYTSLPESTYINDTTTGYAQVDIKAGEPVMVSEIGATNPVSELNDAIAAVEAENNKAKEMPYKISADFIDLNTGASLAESRDLTLDPGANEKAFNTEAETIDGYVLKSIQVDKEGVHAYGVSEKSMKEGIVTMYYYTTKAGWGRHEIKGNIRVTYGYVKKDDPSLEEDGASDVMDDSAWITTEASAVAADDQNAENNADAESTESAADTTTTAQASTTKAAKTSSASGSAQVTSSATQTAAQSTAAVTSGASNTEAADASQEATESATNEGPSVDTETIDLDDVN